MGLKGQCPTHSPDHTHQHAGPSPPSPGAGAFTGPQCIQVTVQQLAESGAAAQSSEKGSAFPMTGPAPQLSRQHPLYFPHRVCHPPTPEGLPPPSAPGCCPREDPGQRLWAWEPGETLTTPGGPALEMGVWLQDGPPPFPPPPRRPRTHPHSPLFSLTASPRQKRSTGQLCASAIELRARDLGTRQHPCCDPSPPPPRPVPLGT